VVAPDLPGYNLSSKLEHEGDYGIASIAGIMARFVEAVAPGEKVTVVGHDVGGMVAWALAALYPDRVERLVAINAPPPTLYARARANNPAQKQASAYVEQLRQRGAEAALRADRFAALVEVMKGPHGLSTPPAGAELDVYRTAWSRPGALEGALGYYRALAAPGVLEPVSGPVAIPALVLWGDQDPYFLPGCLDGLLEHAPHAEVVRRAEGGHWLLHDEPEMVTHELERFLAH
jgi:pimeloyl-ACP methyl ester carboxylesterase